VCSQAFLSASQLFRTRRAIIARVALLATGKLDISHMVRSAKGTIEEPGKDAAFERVIAMKTPTRTSSRYGTMTQSEPLAKGREQRG
jgi:hypothetical protein